MRKVGFWSLTIAGLVGLLAAFSVKGEGGGVSRFRPEGPMVRDPIVWQVGLPDAWLEWQSGLNPTLHFSHWSFLILVASVFALCGALKLRLRTPRKEPSERGAHNE
jgi:hypothetical protein